MRRIVGDIRDVLLRRTMKTPSFFYDNFYDKSNKVMTSYVRLCTLMKTVWINKVRKREVKSGYKILSLEIPTMKPEVNILTGSSFGIARFLKQQNINRIDVLNFYITKQCCRQSGHFHKCHYKR